MTGGPSRVLAIAWDGADWRMIEPLLEAGELPNLERLVSRGVMGNLATLQPRVDPILWASAATGHRGDRHGIIGYLEPTSDGGVQPVTAARRRCAAVWSIASAAGKDVLVVGWPQTPADRVRGTFVNHLVCRAVEDPGEWAMVPGCTHPEEVGAAVRDLRVHPSEIGPEEIVAFVPDARHVDQRRDRRLAEVAVSLAEAATTHAIATDRLEKTPWDLAMLHYDAIDRFGHSFMAYHPPGRERVAPADRAIYGGVMRAVYRFCDAMLGRLLELAGRDTTVVLFSAHGFHSDHLRPADAKPGRGATSWHRDQGIVVLAGPGVCRDEWIWGASLLDVTPTILSVLSLPVGADMAGRPLVRAFREPPCVESIPSWDGQVDPTSDAVPPAALAAERDRLVEQGFVEERAIVGPEASRRARERLEFNLALVQIHAGRVREGAQLLSGLHAADPGSDEYALHLARCLQDLGRLDDSRSLVQEVVGRGLPTRKAELLLSTLAHAEGDYSRALEHLLAADAADPDQPSLHCHIGEVYLKTKQWSEAERAFSKAAALDGDSARAHHGLAVSCLAQGRYVEAADHALSAIGLQYDMPVAHYHLGVALTRAGDIERGRQAFETCLRLAPEHDLARRWFQRMLTGETRADEPTI